MKNHYEVRYLNIVTGKDCGLYYTGQVTKKQADHMIKSYGRCVNLKLVAKKVIK